MVNNNNVFDDLKGRGFVYQHTDEETLRGVLAGGGVRFYVGFDPTGDSLHVGHLLPVMAARRLRAAGHHPIILIGGGTALIGDPSGKQEARPILTRGMVADNVAALSAQLTRLIDDGGAGGEICFVNNAEWLEDIRYIDFLRDFGARFSVNRMLAAESVKQRLETGLSFLEFNYMLLQAYDYYVLNRERECVLQIGGQDQWGNIVAGIELVRKMSQAEVHGLTLPLLLDSQGRKFGKTAGGAVWLDTGKTSEFDYYQFWRNCADDEVGRLLGLFTNLPMDDIKELAALPSPMINRAKEILAFEATSLAHGEAAAVNAYTAAASEFGLADPEGKIQTSSRVAAVKVGSGADGRRDLPTHALRMSDFPDGSVWIVKLLVDSGLCKSNGDARRLVIGGGAYLNDNKIESPELNLAFDDLRGGAILRAGKKNLRRLALGE